MITDLIAKKKAAAISGGGGGHDYSQDYLTFEIQTGGTLRFNSPNFKFVDYRINGSSWTQAMGTFYETVSANDVVEIKATNSCYYDSSQSYSSFSGTNGATFSVSGNIMSLTSGANFATATTLTADSAFQRLFYGCTALLSAENLVLPATTLTASCYKHMFYDCTSLVSPPKELPATTLAQECYSGMFYDCWSMTSTPILPAPTLVAGCYYEMFYVCGALLTVTCLATDISASMCTEDWVYYGGSSSTTFYKAPSMTSWPRSYSGIPSNWTVVDYVAS